MLKIAIIQFPGINMEYETRRAVNEAGMRGEFFRWNDNYKKLATYDGYVISGGFSYEDRGRAGVIASLDQALKVVKTQAAKGKPVLGICNGCQILVESGLVPGVEGNKLAMALARNKRVRDGEVLGTGYYNVWVNLKHVAPVKRSMFTVNFGENEVIRTQIAHTEGRFTTLFPEIIEKLRGNSQILFRYCDPHGVITESFPVNPNGAIFNIAAICNPLGNVMAIMPHLERSPELSLKLFSSLRDSLMKRKASSLGKRIRKITIPTLKLFPPPRYQPESNSLQMFVSLIITDNEAETHEMTLRNLGFPKIGVKRVTHIELPYSLDKAPFNYAQGRRDRQGKPDLQKLMKKLIQSGVLLNTNKEWVTVKFLKEKLTFDAKREKFVPIEPREDEPTTLRLLVREKEDFIGISKLATLQNRLKFGEITGVKIGTLWTFHIPTKSKNVAMDELRKIINTNLFFNPHRQEAVLV